MSIIPKEPVMLLSFMNLKLRDHYDSLLALCEDLELEEQEIINRLEGIGYHYVPEENQFH